MTSAPARQIVSARPTLRLAPEQTIVLLVLLLCSVLTAVLLSASVVPSGSLAGRLISIAGESHSGSVTQELMAQLGNRLRFAATWLLGLTIGLIVLRRPFEQTIAAIPEILTWRSARFVRWEVMGLGGAMLVAVALRVAFMTQPMRYDEALTFNEFASRPLYYGLSFYPAPNNHLLNTLFVHLAFLELGNQPWVLRLPALVGGVLLVAATFGLARLFYGSRSALLSAVLVAVSSYLVEYSTNSRGYTLQALCFVSALSLAAVALRRASLAALLGAAVVSAIGAFALPSMLYGVAVIAAWFALGYWPVRPGRIAVGHLAVSGLVLGLVVTVLYLPVLLISGPDRLAGNRFVVALDPAELARQLPSSLAHTWDFWNRDIPGVFSGTLLVGFALATANALRFRRVPLGVLAPVVCLAIALVQQVAPFERVWLFLLPLYFVIASGGLARFVDGRFLAVAFGVPLAFFTLSSGSILASGETGSFPDAEAVARSLHNRLGADDAVVTLVPASLPELQYYFPRVGLPIHTLVREPSEAAHLYVIAPLDTESPSVSGWSEPVEMERYPSSHLFAERHKT